jgi:hypothetical protein
MTGPWIKPTPWNGKSLQGPYQVTLKIDGVQARLHHDRAVSRAGKPLYNLDAHLPWRPDQPLRIVEVFKDDIGTSVGLVRRKDGVPVPPECIYELWPTIDSRLACQCVAILENPSETAIRMYMADAVYAGFEGLVLRGTYKWIKVKPLETHDVPVTAVLPGTGKHMGRMGALMTPNGKVGTGFSDEEREAWWRRRKHIGSAVIEVAAMSITKDGKFRHPRFVRDRTWDKTANEAA